MPQFENTKKTYKADVEAFNRRSWVKDAETLRSYQIELGFGWHIL